MESLVDEVKRLLAEANYVAVGMMIRASEAPDRMRYEALGLAVDSVVSALETEKQRERIVYLRTMLSWFFREAPGLSSLYREQLRLIHGRSGWQDLSNIARFFTDLSSGGSSSESFEERASSAKEFTERFKEKSEDVQEQVKDFFTQSGIDLDEGLRRAGDFFETISGGKPKRSDPPRDAKDE
jgi:hypothetical protein